MLLFEVVEEEIDWAEFFPFFLYFFGLEDVLFRCQKLENDLGGADGDGWMDVQRLGSRMNNNPRRTKCQFIHLFRLGSAQLQSCHEAS